MKLVQSFPRTNESVAAARRFTVDALPDLPIEVVEVVELMVSELATNCIRHSGSAFELGVTRRGDEVRVEVSDRADGTPTMRSPGPEDPSGRGLQIVNMLSDDWGVQRLQGGGKMVWFVASGRAA